MPIQTGTCAPWATVADLTGECADYDLDPQLVDDFLQIASDVLYELSGRQWSGACERIVHPRHDCRCFRRWRMTAAYEIAGPGAGFTWGWSGIPWDGWGYGHPCGCTISSVTLGAYPLVSVSEVMIDGEVIPADQYRIDNDRFLVRLRDAEGKRRHWPCCPDPTDEEAFRVTFVSGIEPPPAAVNAAAELACQLILAKENSDDCALPERVTSATRQGVTITVLDPMDFLDNGRTGIYSVDLFLKAYNPFGVRRPPSVLSPDVGPRSWRSG